MQISSIAPSIDVVMTGTFAAWRLGTLQARALPFARELGKRGIRCAIVTTPWDMPSEAGVRDVVQGVPLYNTRSTGVLTFPSAVAQQMRTIDRLNPRAVHVFKPKGYGGLSGWLRRRRFPLVVDSDDWEGDGGWNQAGNYSLPQRRLFDWQERRLLRDADLVTAASHLLARRASTLRGSACDVCWIPNGLDSSWANRLAAAGRASMTTQPDEVTIVLYSRFAEFPADWLPRYLASLDAELAPDETVRLITMGAAAFDPVGYSSVNLEQMGYVARESVPGLLGRADIAIYPYVDSLLARSKNSVKLLELMCTGCAVIASATGDIPAVAGDTITLVQTSEPEAFAAKTVALLRDPSLRRGLASAAQQGVINNFRVEAVASKLVTVYQSLGIATE